MVRTGYPGHRPKPRWNEHAPQPRLVDVAEGYQHPLRVEHLDSHGMRRCFSTSVLQRPPAAAERASADSISSCRPLVSEGVSGDRVPNGSPRRRTQASRPPGRSDRSPRRPPEARGAEEDTKSTLAGRRKLEGFAARWSLPSPSILSEPAPSRAPLRSGFPSGPRGPPPDAARTGLSSGKIRDGNITGHGRRVQQIRSLTLQDRLMSESLSSPEPRSL